jgi:hypothetical protein
MVMRSGALAAHDVSNTHYTDEFSETPTPHACNTAGKVSNTHYADEFFDGIG